MKIPDTNAGNLQIRLQDIDGRGDNVIAQNFVAGGTLPVNTWKQVQIPLSSFPTARMRYLGNLYFQLQNSGAVYIDQITFNYITGTAQADRVLDTMDTDASNSAWNGAYADETTATLISVPGVSDGALQFTYAFPTVATGQWANMSRSFGLNALENNANAFRFDYKGSGAKNNLEFKVTDDRSTVFRMLLTDATDTDMVWKTLTVRYADLQYLSGINKTFNFKNVTKFEFAVSADVGGIGNLYVSDLFYLRNPDFAPTQVTGPLISGFAIDNNPFKPRTSAVMSKATFSYTLRELAKVYLKVYDLSGNTVVRLDADVQAPGAHALSWDGLDRNGTLVRNGLYLFQFVAEGANTTQKVRNLIGVAR